VPECPEMGSNSWTSLPEKNPQRNKSPSTRTISNMQYEVQGLRFYPQWTEIRNFSIRLCLIITPYRSAQSPPNQCRHLAV
jgi:hypothetical protein